jgi:hypothetical protein
MIRQLICGSKAWLSGARKWTTAQREALANDVTRPQLIAVTDNLNQAKGQHASFGFVQSFLNHDHAQAIRTLRIGCHLLPVSDAHMCKRGLPSSISTVSVSMLQRRLPWKDFWQAVDFDV